METVILIKDGAKIEAAPGANGKFFVLERGKMTNQVLPDGVYQKDENDVLVRNGKIQPSSFGSIQAAMKAKQAERKKFVADRRFQNKQW